MAQDFQKLLSRKHSLLTDSILVSSWSDEQRFLKVAGFNEYVKNLEIIDGDYYFDFHWIDEIIQKYAEYDDEYFWRFMERGYVHGEAFKDFSRALRAEELSREALIALFYDSVEHMRNLLVFLPQTHPLATIIERRVLEIIKRKVATQKEAEEALLEVSFPDKKNGPLLEQEDLARIRKLFDSGQIGEAQSLLKEHIQQYAYLGYRDPFSSGYDERFFRERLQEEESIPDPKSVQMKFSPEEQKTIDLMKEFVYFRNYRTEKLYEGLFFIENIWRKLAEIFSLDPESFGCYSIVDIEQLFHKNIYLPGEEIEKRKKQFAVLLHEGEMSILRGDEVDEQKRKREKGELSSAVKGMIASKGVAQGVAKIVLTATDQDKVTEGDVLVTTMTTPNFLPSMRRASAFVTDEGGITCHAAIIARELKKPCIIGTKIATKVLKDGDLVEVDAERGVVTILKR